MKNDRGKIVAICAMIMCLAILYTMSGERESLETKADQDGMMLKNDSLTLSCGDDEVFYIRGEGKLSYEDMRTLLAQAQLSTNEIKDVIIGDGITEIGYKVFNSFSYLETLWIGSGVSVINNGAVKNCPMLCYVYIPENVRRIGIDNFFGCNDLFVVTNSTCELLPTIQELKPGHLLEEIHSYEDLLTQRDRVPDYIYKGGDLYTTDSNWIPTKYEYMMLRTNYIQFGPYLSLDKGSYYISLVGKNLDDIQEDNVYAINQGEKIPIHGLSVQESSITYHVVLQDSLPSVEFCVNNKTNKTIEIDRLEIYPEKRYIPYIVKDWWMQND